MVAIPARSARVVIDLVESEKGNWGWGLVEGTGDEEVTAETMVLGVLRERLKIGLWGSERRREGLG